MKSCDKYLEMMSLMLDGELQEPQKTELYAHVEDCAECRRSLELFTALSLDLEPVEPPEGFAADVMSAIRSGAVTMEQPETHSMPKRVFNIRSVWRYAALAACLALCLWAGSQAFSLRGAKPADMDEPQPATFGMVGVITDTPPATPESRSSMPTDAGSQDGLPNVALTPYSDTDYSAGSELLDGAELISEAGTVAVTDEDAVEELVALLQAADAATAPESASDYRLRFEDGSLPVLEIWFSGEEIICRTADTGECFRAQGDASALRGLIARLAE